MGWQKKMNYFLYKKNSWLVGEKLISWSTTQGVELFLKLSFTGNRTTRVRYCHYGSPYYEEKIIIEKSFGEFFFLAMHVHLRVIGAAYEKSQDGMILIER